VSQYGPFLQDQAGVLGLHVPHLLGLIIIVKGVKDAVPNEGEKQLCLEPTSLRDC